MLSIDKHQKISKLSIEIGAGQVVVPMSTRTQSQLVPRLSRTHNQLVPNETFRLMELFGEQTCNHQI